MADVAGVQGWAEVTLNRSPVPLDDPWATVAWTDVLGVPCVVAVRYRWAHTTAFALESPSGVVWRRGVLGDSPIGRRLRLRDGQLRLDNAGRGVEVEWLVEQWPELGRPPPEGARYGMLAFYLSRLWLASRDAKRAPQEGPPTQGAPGLGGSYRIVFETPVELAAGHRLAWLLVETDEARGVPLAYTGYTSDGQVALRGQCDDFREVAPGSWVALRLEEHWYPGSLKSVIHGSEFRADGGPPREYQRPIETAVASARAITDLAVIAEGLVMPKEISRYDDQDRLLMHMQFLSYEIEYEDGRVVYAEP